MKKISQLKLSSKLVIYISFAIIIIYTSIFGFVALNMGPVLIGGVERVADNNVAKYANLFKAYLSEDMQISRTIADGYETYLPYSPKERTRRTIDILQRVFSKHPYYRAMYTSWERKYVDPNWTKSYGRIRVSLFTPPKYDGDTTNYTLDTLNSYGDDINSLYYRSKTQQKNELSDPYDDVYFGVKETVASVFTPFVKDGKFLGSTGIDIPLSRFTDVIASAEKFYGSSIFLLSNNGIFVGNQVEYLVGKNITDIIKTEDIDILEKINKGEAFSIDANRINDDDFYVTFYPFTVADATKPWMVGVAMPRSEMTNMIKAKFKSLLIVSILGLIIIILIIYFLSKGVTGPLSNITEMLKLLARGEINKVEVINIEREDEIGGIIDSTNILVENLKKTATFAEEIGKGNLETEFESLSEGDILGNSLINMRGSLYKANKEEKKRRREEEKQNWATKGYAKFGELLRNNTDNMETFTYNVISNLIKYTNSNQGAIFLLNTDDENDTFLTMSSCYAYSRKKYVDKRIDIGSNLVGQCYLEGETIYMTDIPEDYISITSGLGDANPNTLILVPLKFNDKVYGVMELASFNNFDAFQIEFIEKLGESIASTISTVRVNLQTIQLLEESKLKSEELAAQEEEMRQNMEELQTTQEESARRELDMNGILAALNSSYLVMELNLDAEIININENAKRLLNVTGEVEGYNLRSFLKQEELDDFEEMWQTVISGEYVNKHHNIFRSGKSYIISESYTPIYNDMDEVYKVLNLGVELENNRV